MADGLAPTPIFRKSALDVPPPSAKTLTAAAENKAAINATLKFL
jgi:hypothetical protein